MRKFVFKPDPIFFQNLLQLTLQLRKDVSLYYLVQGKKQEEVMRPVDLFSFVAAKKVLALLLLGAFTYMGISHSLTQKPISRIVHAADSFIFTRRQLCDYRMRDMNQPAYCFR